MVHGHFVFVDPGFFTKKDKKIRVLHFKDSWDDVLPLLSKSIKNNLFLESSGNSAEYSDKKLGNTNGCPLLVVQTFSMDHSGIKKPAQYMSPKRPAEKALKENEMGDGNSGPFNQELKNGEDMYVTSSGSILTPTLNIQHVGGDY